MESPMDQTTLSTITLLEARLLQLEHLVYGDRASNALPQGTTVTVEIEDLERRLATLVSHVRVYNDLYQIYKAYPSLFQEPDPSAPPPDLKLDEVRAIVLAAAASFPATESALRAVIDCPIPDPSQSTALISQMERIKAIETTQLAQAAEMAQLRVRSEEVIRAWYEGSALASSQFVAELEGRVSVAERFVRRAERAKAEGDVV